MRSSFYSTRNEINQTTNIMTPNSFSFSENPPVPLSPSSSVRYSFDLSLSEVEKTNFDFLSQTEEGIKKNCRFWKYISIFLISTGFISFLFGCFRIFHINLFSSENKFQAKISPSIFAEKICNSRKEQFDQEITDIFNGFCISETEFVRCINGSAIVVNETPVQQCSNRPGTVVEDAFPCEGDAEDFAENCIEI
eukprot:snap_masked-scaffold_24-processed-gene-3.26-mRNA-1 protein AED:1.00 eAED:1.00 QI:0/0/0/0/1/1/2/0/193